MDGNLTQNLTTDSLQYQAVLNQFVSEAVKALPRPNTPSWLQQIFDNTKDHPWVSLGIVFLVLLVITIIIREIICSYLKTNEIISRLKKLEDKMNKGDSL